ncbi:hypothetical protein CRG98_038335 [Punica granatum]|uniref:Uncharacterized protein n=1 Tax=Punica granatum TaxID=22663 RepID=A0A2I0IBT6_PUNGR|nr:hypothetical protein CRG98_038335 [Punica granatum]
MNCLQILSASLQGSPPLSPETLKLGPPVHSGRAAVRGLSVLSEGHGLDLSIEQFVDVSKRAGMIPLNDKEIYWFFVCKTSPKVVPINFYNFTKYSIQVGGEVGWGGWRERDKRATEGDGAVVAGIEATTFLNCRSFSLTKEKEGGGGAPGPGHYCPGDADNP